MLHSVIKLGMKGWWQVVVFFFAGLERNGKHPDHLLQGLYHSNHPGFFLKGHMMRHWVPQVFSGHDCHEYRKFKPIFFCHTKIVFCIAVYVCTASWRDIFYSLQSILACLYRASELQVRIGNRQASEPLPLRNLVEGIPIRSGVIKHTAESPT